MKTRPPKKMIRYISIRSWVLTPVYFNLVNMDIHEYAVLKSSLVLEDQFSASSSTEHPNNVVAAFWSIFGPPTESLVTKSTFALERSM